MRSADLHFGRIDGDADLKGHLPHWFADQVALPQLMHLPYKLQAYFLQVQPPMRATAAGGAILGHLCMDLVETTKRLERATAIRMFVERTAVLRECGFAHLDAFIGGIFDERLLFTLGLGFRKFKTVSVPEVVATNPALVTAGGAALVGKGLESIVRMSSTPAEAIDELIGKYPALKVIADRHVWFRPLLETIAKRRLAAAPLGLKARLMFGAGFSFLDMVSDINNIRALFLAGRSTDAFVLLGMIALNLAVQALVVTLQNSHRGLRAVLWELGVVFSLLKPGIDAARVAGGAERVEGAPLDPFVEMVFCKLIEMTFESIPGWLAQAIFLLNGGDWTTAAVVSVVLSCVSTAYIATTLVYDLDTEPTRRKSNPEFYGYIPHHKRALVFTLLFLYHTVWSLGKTFSMAVLAQTNLLLLVVYLFSDHCGLILYKLARRDLIYWVPGLGWPVSMLVRIGGKVVVDFTGYAVHLTATGLDYPPTGFTQVSSLAVLQLRPLSPPDGVGRHLFLRQRAHERPLVVRRGRSLLAVLSRWASRAGSLRQREHLGVDGKLLRQRHRRQLHRCSLRFRIQPN
jgi:hypothetical protein